MKKFISCLLVVMILLTAVSAFADNAEKSNVLTKFVEETDKQKQDIAVKTQSGDDVSDLVIRSEGTTLHLVSRENGVEKSHVQLDPNGIYVSSEGNVTLLRYATVTTIMQDIFKGISSIIGEALKYLPEEELVNHSEIDAAINELSIMLSEEVAQEQADAATLSAAAMAFADNFKPEYILDVKGDDDSMEITLRSEAFAVAIAEAMDEMMMNPDLAELVDRQVEDENDVTFAEIQEQWAEHREEILDAISSFDATQTIDAKGHFTGSYEFGEDIQRRAWSPIPMPGSNLKKAKKLKLPIPLASRMKIPLSSMK